MNVNNQPPNSILGCKQSDGKINMESWLCYQRILLEYFDDDANISDVQNSFTVSNRITILKSCNCCNLNMRRLDHASLEQTNPKQSSW